MTSLYMQLYDTIRSEILKGVYPYGSKLASKRQICDDFGMSVITVEHAMALLEEEGYIEARERSGYYVSYIEGDNYQIPSFSGASGGEHQVPPAHGTSDCEHRIPPAHGISDCEHRIPTAHGISDCEHRIPPAHGTSGCDHQAPYVCSGSSQHSSALFSHTFGSYPAAVTCAPAIQDPLPEAVRPGDTELFPFGIYARTIRRVLTDRGESIFTKSPGKGTPELRQTISEYLARNRNIYVSPGQIVIGSGAEYLYGMVVQILGRDRIYGIEKPSYEKIELVYGANDVPCRLLALGHDGILSGELNDTDADILHITPYRSYPSGVTANAAKRREYIRWAESREDRFIVEDDFESEFTPSTKAQETVFSLSEKGNVIYINTFSRTIAPSMRIGYMVLPERLLARYEKRAGFYSCAVPTFEQYILAEFIDSGDFERHINRVRRKRRRPHDTPDAGRTSQSADTITCTS